MDPASLNLTNFKTHERVMELNMVGDIKMMIAMLCRWVYLPEVAWVTSA